MCLRATDHLEDTKVAVSPSLLRPTVRPVRQRSGLAVTEEWRPGRRRATQLPDGGAGDPERRAEWMTVLRCDHLRSAPVVVDVVYARSGNRLHSVQRSVNSMRSGASPMALRLSGDAFARLHCHRLHATPSDKVQIVTRSHFRPSTSREMQNGDYQRFLALAGCGGHCANLSRETGSLLQPTAQLALSHPA